MCRADDLRRITTIFSRKEFLDFLKATCALEVPPAALPGSSPSQSDLLAVSSSTNDSSETIFNDTQAD